MGTKGTQIRTRMHIFDQKTISEDIPEHISTNKINSIIYSWISYFSLYKFIGKIMRKGAQNCQNFTVKNVTFLFLVGLGWNSNSILTLLKASFLLIFKAEAQKKSYVFYKISVFLWRFVRWFLSTKNIAKLIEILSEVFQKVKYYMP